MSADHIWAALAADLDRCQHGRHEGDVCADCGGPSRGNPNMGGPGFAARQIGFTISGWPIVIPEDRSDRMDPRNWVVRPGDSGRSARRDPSGPGT